MGLFPCPAPPTACVVRRRKKALRVCTVVPTRSSTHDKEEKRKKKNTAAGAPPGIDKGTWELGCSLTVSEAAKHLPPLCLVPFLAAQKRYLCVSESLSSDETLRRDVGGNLDLASSWLDFP